MSSLSKLNILDCLDKVMHHKLGVRLNPNTPNKNKLADELKQLFIKKSKKPWNFIKMLHEDQKIKNSLSSLQKIYADAINTKLNGFLFWGENMIPKIEELKDQEKDNQKLTNLLQRFEAIYKAGEMNHENYTKNSLDALVTDLENYYKYHHDIYLLDDFYYELKDWQDLLKDYFMTKDIYEELCTA